MLCVGTVAMAGLSACGGGDSNTPGDTLPAGWSGAQALTIDQSACKGSAPAVTTTFELTETGILTGTIKDLSFRCQQTACAYVTDDGATTRVLVQPCDLHPTSVPKCGCQYDVTFTLPARAARTAVEVYRRDDYYGATTAPEPTLVATRPVGTTSLHWYKTCGDVVCGVGANAPDAGAVACSMEKQGDTCTSSGASCDPGDGCNVRLLCAEKDPRVQPGGCPISRREAKRDIAYLDDAALGDLATRLRAVRLARYRYKDAPERERLGFMIDDGQGSLAVDQVRDQIDLYSYLSWTVAALQAEMKRVDAQGREIARLRREIARRGSR
jgi:hypothetical protein